MDTFWAKSKEVEENFRHEPILEFQAPKKIEDKCDLSWALDQAQNLSQHYKTLTNAHNSLGIRPVHLVFS